MTDDLCIACVTYPPETPGMWICTRCADGWHYGLLALIGYRDDRGEWQRGLLDELGVETRRQARKGSGGPRVSTSPEPPEPANLAASGVADEIRWHLVGAATMLARADGLELPADRIGSIVAWHVTHEDRMARYGGCADIVTGLADLLRKARRVIDTPAERVLVGHCPGCRRPIMATVGHASAWCGECDLSVDAEESRDALLASVGDMYLPLRQIADLLGREYKTVWSWADRGHLAQHDTDPKRFRLGDAITKGARPHARTA